MPGRMLKGSLYSALIIPILLLAELAFSSLSYATEQDFDRSGFGEASAPLWTPLTDFERSTLENHSPAARGDSGSVGLMALYLLASGEVRTDAEFRHYRELFDRGLSRLEARMEDATSAADKGERLLHGMHEYFFADIDDADVDILAAYDATQSQLTRVLSDGVYNCISSSLLYIVLAEHFGLQASGVLLPSHAFVQLHLPDGDLVEVETTAVNGYGLVHDEAFYNDADNAWFIERDLEVPEYEDYLNRRIVTAAELGLENMWNQHAGPERMSYRDRMRLAEIHGHLRPGDHAAQKNRLIFYTREFDYLHGQQNTETLSRLFEQIAPYLRAMEELATSSTAGGDTEFRSLLAWLQAARANTEVAGDEPEGGLALARATLLALDDELPEVAAIRNNLYLALDRYAQRRVGQQAYAQARQAFAGLESGCAMVPACSTALTRLYADWAAAYWSMEDWSEVVYIYEDYLALDMSADDEQLIRDNLMAAYLNWANRDWFDEHREQAMERLERCVAVLVNADSCSGRLQEMRRVY